MREDLQNVAATCAHVSSKLMKPPKIHRSWDNVRTNYVSLCCGGRSIYTIEAHPCLETISL